jgi:hypothetical protein
MLNKRSYLFFGALILIIITFDAFQQKYYLDTFDLAPGESITLSQLFQSHLLRWLTWGVFSLIYSFYAHQSFQKHPLSVPLTVWLKITILMILSLISSIVVITSYIILSSPEVSVSLESVLEVSEFILFQKGLSFLFVAGLLVLLLYSHSRSKLIEAQWIEIESLKTESEPVSNIRIRIGNRIKLIPVKNIRWIEADDYCVKIHTEDKAYSMRKSLKSLEDELAPFGFVRSHRSSMVNMEHLEHVDFDASLIKMKDHTEVPLSKSGAKSVRKIIDHQSL